MRATAPDAPETGFWPRFERFLLKIHGDPEARARVFWWSWIITLAFTAFGFAIIFKQMFYP